MSSSESEELPAPEFESLKPRNHCRVSGCTKSLSEERIYCKRHGLCEEHLKSLTVLIDGKSLRFCQQCGRLHDVDDFEGDKRSCRTRLKSRNTRRAAIKRTRSEAARQQEQQQKQQQEQEPGVPQQHRRVRRTKTRRQAASDDECTAGPEGEGRGGSDAGADDAGGTPPNGVAAPLDGGSATVGRSTGEATPRVVTPKSTGPADVVTARDREPVVSSGLQQRQQQRQLHQDQHDHQQHHRHHHQNQAKEHQQHQQQHHHFQHPPGQDAAAAGMALPDATDADPHSEPSHPMKRLSSLARGSGRPGPSADGSPAAAAPAAPPVLQVQARPPPQLPPQPRPQQWLAPASRDPRLAGNTDANTALALQGSFGPYADPALRATVRKGAGCGDGAPVGAGAGEGLQMQHPAARVSGAGGERGGEHGSPASLRQSQRLPFQEQQQEQLLLLRRRQQQQQEQEQFLWQQRQQRQQEQEQLLWQQRQQQQQQQEQQKELLLRQQQQRQDVANHAPRYWAQPPGAAAGSAVCVSPPRQPLQLPPAPGPLRSMPLPLLSTCGGSVDAMLRLLLQELVRDGTATWAWPHAPRGADRPAALLAGANGYGAARDVEVRAVPHGGYGWACAPAGGAQSGYRAQRGSGGMGAVGQYPLLMPPRRPQPLLRHYHHHHHPQQLQAAGGFSPRGRVGRHGSDSEPGVDQAQVQMRGTRAWAPPEAGWYGAQPEW